MTIGHSGKSSPIVVGTCLNGGSTKYNCCKPLGIICTLILSKCVVGCGLFMAISNHSKVTST